MPTLYIIRGLPGSGKSTHASDLFEQIHTTTGHTPEWFEADMFFNTRDLKYNWNPKYLPAAHNWCYFNTLQALYTNTDTIVSNTFTTGSEVSNYLNLRTLIPNLRIELIELHTQFKSIHNVPDEAIARMRNRWESFDLLPFDKTTLIGDPS